MIFMVRTLAIQLTSWTVPLTSMSDQLLSCTMPSTGGDFQTTLPTSAPTVQSSLSSSNSPELSPYPTESLSDSKSRKRSPPADPETAIKRQRNNVAARKYRQKKIDRISELELELKGVKDDRDDLRVRLARQEAEAAALRSLLKIKTGIEL
jgi:hypothetical protein